MTATEEILVLSATAFEQLDLREVVTERVQRKVAEREWVSGKIGAQPVTLVATGIGAVNTAHALTCYLQAQRPRADRTGRRGWGISRERSKRRGLGLGQ